MDACMDGWTDGYMHGSKDGSINGRMDRWRDRWMDGSMMDGLVKARRTRPLRISTKHQRTINALAHPRHGGGLS